MRLFGVWLLGVISGCGALDSVEHEEDITGDVEVGADLFIVYCSGCHGMDGAGGRAPSLLSGSPAELSYEENQEEIIRRMRREGLEGALSEVDIEDLIAYLYYIQGRY